MFRGRGLRRTFKVLGRARTATIELVVPLRFLHRVWAFRGAIVTNRAARVLRMLRLLEIIFHPIATIGIETCCLRFGIGCPGYGRPLLLFRGVSRRAQSVHTILPNPLQQGDLRTPDAPITIGVGAFFQCALPNVNERK